MKRSHHSQRSRHSDIDGIDAVDTGRRRLSTVAWRYLLSGSLMLLAVSA